MSMRIILAYIALFCCPFFFSSNAIFGRLAQDIEPFTLAFLRWSLTGAFWPWSACATGRGYRRRGVRIGDCFWR